MAFLLVLPDDFGIGVVNNMFLPPVAFGFTIPDDIRGNWRWIRRRFAEGRFDNCNPLADPFEQGLVGVCRVERRCPQALVATVHFNRDVRQSGKGRLPIWSLAAVGLFSFDVRFGLGHNRRANFGI